MRRWNTPDDLILLHRVLVAIREERMLEPVAIGLGDPLDLRGLSFPTVDLCKEIGLETMIVSSVVGRQVFNDATLRRIDFSRARLDFSVWNDCRFEHLQFDNAKLQNVKFFGCRFIDCSFRSASLKDASFSVGRKGTETEVIRTIFEKVDFRGASCHNPVLRSSSFLNCKLDGFVFDSPLCDNIDIAGEYHELTFRGATGEPFRNRLHVNLSKATVTWLNADNGLDLTAMTLPLDGSCVVLSNRVQAVTVLCQRLSEEAGKAGKEVARLIAAIYSNRSMSPLEQSQTTFAITKGQIKNFLETDGDAIANPIFAKIRVIAEQEKFLVIKN